MEGWSAVVWLTMPYGQNGWQKDSAGPPNGGWMKVDSALRSENKATTEVLRLVKKTPGDGRSVLAWT